MSKHYGWKIGDIVDVPIYQGKTFRAVIVCFDDLDNNKCFVKSRNGTIYPAICEWLKHPTHKKGGK